MSREIIKRQAAERIWLHYYNQQLYSRGIISEIERNKMSQKIESRRVSEPETRKRPGSLRQ